MSDKMSDFELDSKGHCLFCLEKIWIGELEPEEVAVPSPVPKSSLLQLSRYLKLDMGKVLNGRLQTPSQLVAAVGNSRLKVELCLKCTSVNGKVSELYRQLEKLEMEIGSCLKFIHRKLAAEETEKVEQLRKLIDKDDNINSGVDGLTKMEMLERVRAETLKKCSQKLRADMPRIKIKSLTTKANSLETGTITTSIIVQPAAYTATQNAQELDEGTKNHIVIGMESETKNPDDLSDDAAPSDDIDLQDDQVNSDEAEGGNLTGKPARICSLKLRANQPRVNVQRLMRNTIGMETATTETSNAHPLLDEAVSLDVIDPDLPNNLASFEDIDELPDQLLDTDPASDGNNVSVDGHSDKLRDKPASDLDPTSHQNKPCTSKQRRRKSGYLVCPTGAQNVTIPQSVFIPETGKYKCGLCVQEFNQLQSYKKHYKSSHLNFKYKCTACEKEFKSSEGYRCHHSSVHMGLRFLCIVCGRRFPGKGALRQHLRAASCRLGKAPKPKKYICNCQICGTGFTQKGNLKRHFENVHSHSQQK